VHLRSLALRAGAMTGAVAFLLGCGGPAARPCGAASRSAPALPTVRFANIGGYRLAYECAGAGSPTVILEAGYTASGIDTYGSLILPELARRTRACTYDRAGDGLSDPRPASVHPVTAASPGWKRGPRPGWRPCRPTPSMSWTAGSVTSFRRWIPRSWSPRCGPC
jgi:pimeloyl-ACP methyl ester carboxylesterase